MLEITFALVTVHMLAMYLWIEVVPHPKLRADPRYESLATYTIRTWKCKWCMHSSNEVLEPNYCILLWGKI